MDYKVELAAQAFYESDPEADLWNNESAVRKEEFREFARKAINLLNEDIGVLLLALDNASAEERVEGTRLAARRTGGIDRLGRVAC
jgi:hypothetical protein